MPEFKCVEITDGQARAINALHEKGAPLTDVWPSEDGATLFGATGYGEVAISSSGNAAGAPATLLGAPAAAPADATAVPTAPAPLSPAEAAEPRKVQGEDLSMRDYTTARRAGWQPGEPIPESVELRDGINNDSPAAA